MSANLGVADLTSIDIAIRESLKSLVDHAYADGEISANSAEERKAAIDEAMVPIAVGTIHSGVSGGSSGRGGLGGNRGSNRPGRAPGGEKPMTDEPAAESTPAT